MKPFRQFLTLIVGGVFLLACTSSSSNTSVSDQAEISEAPEIIKEKTIVALGDSLTEGFQLPSDQAYPSQLEDWLEQEGYPQYRVVNAGISGDTSLGVLSRKEWIQRQNPDIVLLVIGANDALRGFDLTQTRQHIAETIAYFQDQDVDVVLGGMEITENLGQDYVESFAQLYPSLATEFKTPLIPFFLEGVAADPDLNLPDQIHPNAEGYGIVVKENVWPVLKELLEAPEQDPERSSE